MRITKSYRQWWQRCLDRHVSQRCPDVLTRREYRSVARRLMRIGYSPSAALLAMQRSFDAES